MPSVLITGASDGIGRAIVDRYHTDGWTITAHGRRAREQIEPPLPESVRYVRCDLARLDIDSFAQLMAEVPSDLDVAILNAGVGLVASPRTTGASDIANMVAVNTNAPLQLAHRLHDRLAATNGKLVFIGSTAARGRHPDFAVHAATKAALTGAARALRLEWSDRIDVRIIHPGPTATDMHDKAGLGPTPLQLDLLDETAVADLVAAIGDGCSEIYHCAGISGTGRFEHIPAEHHARVLALNFEVPIQITCALLAADACSHDARHVFIGSVSTFTGYPGATSYAASKDGLASFARSLSPSLPGQMSAHCVFPGPLRTDHAARYAPDSSDAVVKRRQDPNEAAQTILRDVARGRRRIFPTVAARGFAAAGTVLPVLTGRALRKSLFEKLTTPRL